MVLGETLCGALPVVVCGRVLRNEASGPPLAHTSPNTPFLGGFKKVYPPPPGEGKDKRERAIVVVRSPFEVKRSCRCTHRRAQFSTGVGKPRMDLECASGCTWSTARAVSGTANPGVVKQDKSSRGSVDTTKTRSGPQGVRMSSGERPIGAAKGKQTNTMASCQTPPVTTILSNSAEKLKTCFVDGPPRGTELIEYQTACPTNTPLRTVFFEDFYCSLHTGGVAV